MHLIKEKSFWYFKIKTLLQKVCLSNLFYIKTMACYLHRTRKKQINPYFSFQQVLLISVYKHQMPSLPYYKTLFRTLLCEIMILQPLWNVLRFPCIYYTCRIFRDFFRKCWFFFFFFLALLVLRNVPSPVASDQSIGLRRCDKTFFTPRFLICKTTFVIPKRFLSAFNMISLTFAAITFDLNVLKDINLIFGQVSKNVIVRSAENLFVKKSTSTWPSSSLAVNISVTTFSSGEAPVNKLPRSNSSLVNGLN